LNLLYNKTCEDICMPTWVPTEGKRGRGRPRETWRTFLKDLEHVGKGKIKVNVDLYSASS